MRLKDSVLEQTVIDLDPQSRATRATGAVEEVLFVVAGEGELRVHGERHALEAETGVNLAPGEEYELHNSGETPMRFVSVRIPDRDPASPGNSRVAASRDETRDEIRAAASPGEDRVTVRRLADQEAQAATTQRWFRIVADPDTGLRSATQFVGYIPTERAPEHFHTYDEVIYILDGEGAFHANGETISLTPGSTVELPARTVHCLENTGPDVMRLVAVFRPAGSPAEAYYPDGTPAYPVTPRLTTPNTQY